MYYTFCVLEFLFLELSLDLLWIEKLKRIRYEFKALIGLVDDWNMVTGLLILTKSQLSKDSEVTVGWLQI